MNILDEGEERDNVTFQYHVRELTSAILGDDALRNQKDYLKTTPKPERMSVKQWINRLKNINSYLPLMQRNVSSFSEEDLVTEVIAKNIPAAWVKDFNLAKLHLQTKIKDVMADFIRVVDRVLFFNRSVGRPVWECQTKDSANSSAPRM